MEVSSMGVRISGDDSAVFYDSTTNFAFGPVFLDEDEADDFLEFYNSWGKKPFDDIRQMTIADWKVAQEAFAVWLEVKYGETPQQDHS
jgi:hypothetical protein